MLAAMIQVETEDDPDQNWASDVDCGLRLSSYLFATYLNFEVADQIPEGCLGVGVRELDESDDSETGES